MGLVIFISKKFPGEFSSLKTSQVTRKLECHSESLTLTLLYCGKKHWRFLLESDGGSEVKVFACNAGDPGSIPGLGRSLGWEDPLEKEMAIYCSILAWRIPWREESGRLQSTGSQRVGGDFTFTFFLELDGSEI